MLLRNSLLIKTWTTFPSALSRTRCRPVHVDVRPDRALQSHRRLPRARLRGLHPFPV